MGSRGARPLEEKIGVDRFKELLKRLTIGDIAELYCEHKVEPKAKRFCRACTRSIYRAKKRVERKQKADRAYEPQDNFDLIPEIQAYIEYEAAKGKKKNHVNQLREFWNWIREDPELSPLSRPALWDERHIMLCLKKLKEKQVSLYHPKQSFRRLFESMNSPLFKNPLIRASRKDMRNPKGASRKQMDFSPQMIPKIWECIDAEEKLAVDLHLTVKSREGDRGQGSLLDTQWTHINWKDSFYGFEMATIDIYEPKTKGGTWWRHCPLDLWFADLSGRLRDKWERLGKPQDGWIFDFTYRDYLKLWLRISEHVGRKLEPHDCRRSAGGWLRDLGCSELALGQFNPTLGDAIGYAGVGWENSEIYFQRYGKMNPKAIYNKAVRLDVSVFDGLITKILENK